MLNCIRCAVHFGKAITYSADDPLYSRLLHTEVYTSEAIVETTSLKLNGIVLATQDSPGTFHLQEDENLLRLYVPHDARLQELCYLTQIPPRLALLFSAADPAAEKVLGDVFKASPVVLDDVLLDEGIIQIPGVNPLPVAVDSRPRSVSEADVQNCCDAKLRDNLNATSGNESTVIGSQDPVYETRAFASRENTPSRGTLRLPPLVGSDVAASQAFLYPRDTLSEMTEISRNREYCKLFNQIIQAAGRIELPDSQTTRRASADGLVGSNISLQSCFGNRADNPLEHDIRVGAAGELFVSHSAFKILAISAS